MRLYRASRDNYVGRGTSFAMRREDAEAYQDNLGFGGPIMFCADLPDDHRLLDLVDVDGPWETLSEVVGWEVHPDMGGYMISQALQLIPGILGEIADAGYDWARYEDDFPHGCITYTACSDDAQWIEIEE